MIQFKALSLSYKTAPVEIREQIALSEQETKLLFQQIKDFTSITEALILSTCNRTEIYYSSPKDLSEELIKLIGIRKGTINTTEKYSNYFKNITDTNQAIEHLFRVSMGLESQVVGDIQISNQVKNAYQWSADLEMAGPFLHHLMHAIFFTNKRVTQETPFRDGAASVSYATVELIDELTAIFREPRILILGLGEMGADVCRNLQGSDFSNVFIANRTHSKATALANECGFTAVSFENMWEEIQKSDVIVSSVSMPTPLITEEKMKEVEVLSFKYFIDMAVPRNIDPNIEKNNGVVLFDIDKIQNKTNEALQKRIDSIPQVEAIIEEAIIKLQEWGKEMEVSPTIQKLKGALETIRQEEMNRYMKQLSEEEIKAVEMVTQTMMQKIIKLPVLQLKAACKRGEAETLIDVLNDIFNLEKQEELQK
ncbi:MAG: glutamyl-tRNA reductase [Cytophagales bacterium]|nr:glutamyl-tRNA reductase [Cytophagales bacterium]